MSLCVLMLMAGFHFSVSKASAADTLKLGVLQEPKTLNIWSAGDRWSLKILGLIYQPLYVRDPKTLDLVPWLAAAPPEFDSKNLCYTVKLRPARWSDGTELTSEDVAFTGRIIQEFKIPRHISKWQFVKRIETPDKHTIKFYLESPQAIFVSRTLTTPIVQKKQWEEIIQKAKGTEKPLRTLLRHKVKKPIGIGPFTLKDWRSGAYLYVVKNEDFFGSGKTIGGHLLGPHIDGIIFKIYGTSDAAILALKKGSIDMFWWGIQPGYMEDLKANPDMEVFTNEKSAPGVWFENVFHCSSRQHVLVLPGRSEVRRGA